MMFTLHKTRCRVLRVITMKITVFWAEYTYSSALNRQAVGSSEMSVNNTIQGITSQKTVVCITGRGMR
jgi:hypothetical protein